MREFKKQMAGKNLLKWKARLSHLTSNGFTASIYRLFAAFLGEPGLDLGASTWALNKIQPISGRTCCRTLICDNFDDIAI